MQCHVWRNEVCWKELIGTSGSPLTNSHLLPQCVFHWLLQLLYCSVVCCTRALVEDDVNRALRTWGILHLSVEVSESEKDWSGRKTKVWSFSFCVLGTERFHIWICKGPEFLIEVACMSFVGNVFVGERVYWNEQDGNDVWREILKGDQRMEHKNGRNGL